MISQEELAAENVLKRAELARISRQLKSRLSKTNLKIKDRSSPSSHHKLSSSSTVSPIKKPLQSILTSSAKKNERQQSPRIIGTSDILTTPTSKARIMFKRKSTESFDLNKTEDEAEDFDDEKSNIKYKRPIGQPLPPSSPMYEEFAIPTNPPSTPPQQKIHINAEIYNTASTNKTYIQNSSSPVVHNSAQQQKQQQLQKQLLSTPDQKHHDEGADLLMFLATSPSPAQYKQPPSTPSRLVTSKFNQSSSIQRLGGTLNNATSSNPLNINATPGTPMRNLLKTPGFNMNDYVNLFTPSPGHMAKTPDQFSKDVNGKLIKF